MGDVENRAIAQVDKDSNPKRKESRANSEECTVNPRSRFVSDRMTPEEVLAWKKEGTPKKRGPDPMLQHGGETEGVSIGSLSKSGIIERGIRKMQKRAPNRPPQQPRYKDYREQPDSAAM